MGVSRFSFSECIMNQNCNYFGSSIVQCQEQRDFVFLKRLHRSCGTLGKFSLCVPGTVYTSWQKWNPCGHWNEIVQHGVELTWTLFKVAEVYCSWQNDQKRVIPWTLRVKGEMSLRNGIWHGLRNDIIMRNIIYAEWPRENIKLKSARFFSANRDLKIQRRDGRENVA